MELQKKLKELMEQKNLKQAYVCRATGISASKLSQWLKGKYNKGNKDSYKAINEAVESFIKRENSKRNLTNFNTEFLDISISNIIFEISRNCHYKSELGVVFGDAGLGKTTAIEKYSAENPDVILVKANPSYTQRFLIQELHKKVGYEGVGAIYIMLNEIISKLKNSGRLIIVDQAEYLTQASLELLRTIYDEAKTGLLLVGMPKLYFNLKGKNSDFRQLFTRVGYNIKLGNLKPEDTEMIVKANIPEINDLWKTYHTISLANTRHLSMLLKRSIEISELNNIEIKDLSPKAIKEIGEKLLVIEG